MTPEELSLLDVEVKLLDIHWTEILKLLVHLPPSERFLKRDQLEWLIKKGQPVLRELVLQHKVDQDQIQEVIALMDDCSSRMVEAKKEIDRLRLLASKSRQFFETLNEGVGMLEMVPVERWRDLYLRDFQQMQQALAIAGYEPVAVGE